jgi:hypothetical protein
VGPALAGLPGAPAGPTGVGPRRGPRSAPRG